MTNPSKVLEPPVNLNPIVDPMVKEPFNSITGLFVNPDCVVPLITVESAITGKAANGIMLNGGVPMI